MQTDTQKHTTTDIAGRLAFLKMDDACLERLRELRPVIARDLPEGLERFYHVIRQTPETRQFFSSDQHMKSAQKAQIGHWMAILEGRFDNDYTRRVQRIGNAHARIGLAPSWYIGGYSLLMAQLIAGIVDEYWPKKRLSRSASPSAAKDFSDRLVSLTKAVLLDMELSVSVYIEEVEAARKAEQDAVDAERNMVMGAFRNAIQALAKKDLTYQIDADLPDGYATVKADFNAALQQLAATMDEIGGSAEKIQSGSVEINAAASDLSRRAEIGAASVEETAAALEEMTANVKSSFERAEKAGDMVAQTRQKAESSGQIVTDAVEAMGRIDSSSEAISSIIAVIDEIAFQTNLLALNAGVEAARAGESGRGFAVVASEVRVLAQRSAGAAKEIKQLIEGSRKEVKTGVQLVSNTGEALARMVEDVRQISQDVLAVVDSAREQSAGLDEINAAVLSLDTATQQNAAIAEELSAASDSLSSEVHAINAMLATFQALRETEDAADLAA